MAGFSHGLEVAFPPVLQLDPKKIGPFAYYRGEVADNDTAWRALVGVYVGLEQLGRSQDVVVDEDENLSPLICRAGISPHSRTLAGLLQDFQLEPRSERIYELSQAIR